jgi:hypothetical protein
LPRASFGSPRAGHDDRTRLLGVARPVHLAAGGDHRGLVALQIEVEVRQHMILDAPPLLAQRFEFRELGDDLRAPHDQAFARQLRKRGLQRDILQRDRSALLEVAAYDPHQDSVVPIAASAIPASTSATW